MPQPFPACFADVQPGQLTRIQRFGFQIQVHVGDRVGEAGVVVGQQGRDKMAEASGAITGTGQGGVERVMVKVKAAHRLHGKGPGRHSKVAAVIVLCMAA